MNRKRKVVLVLTPQLVEFDTLHADFAERGHDVSRRNVGRIECWGIPTLDIEMAVAGHGKAVRRCRLSTCWIDFQKRTESYAPVGPADSILDCEWVMLSSALVPLNTTIASDS